MIEAATTLLALALMSGISFIGGMLAVCRAIRRRYPEAYDRIQAYQAEEQQAGRKLYPGR